MDDAVRVRLQPAFREKYRKAVRTAFGFSGSSPYHGYFGKKKGHNSGGGPVKPPTISVGKLKLVAQRLGILQEEIEAAVLHLTLVGSGLEYPLKFPITIGRDHAWLIGLLYANGGFRNRPRDQGVRMVIDPELLEPTLALCERIGNRPHVITNMHRKMKDGRLWNGKRYDLQFNKLMHPLLVRLGFTVFAPVRSGGGKYLAARERLTDVPDWIKTEQKLLNAFTEGYLNGMRAQSWMHPDRQGSKTVVSSGVHVRFVGVTPEKIMKVVVDYLESLGITGKAYRQHRSRGSLRHYNYITTGKESAAILLKKFVLHKTDLRVRLKLKLAGDRILLEAMKRMTSQEIVLAGILTERPRLRAEVDKLVRRTFETDAAVAGLIDKKMLAVGPDGVMRIDLTGFKAVVKTELESKMSRQQAAIQAYLEIFPAKCTRCSAVCGSDTCDECGASTRPVKRDEIIRPLRQGLGQTRHRALVFSE